MTKSVRRLRRRGGGDRSEVQAAAVDERERAQVEHDVGPAGGPQSTAEQLFAEAVGADQAGGG
jgi:hypothetical protein